MEDLIYIRVLQHDTEDQIRIGNAYPVTDLDKAENNIVALYEKRTAWCCGFKAACKQYYKRIAIVDADTLEVIRSIYGAKKENDPCSFVAGSNLMKEKAIEAFKTNCPCWSRFEQGKKCEECSWLKDFSNKLNH